MKLISFPQRTLPDRLQEVKLSFTFSSLSAVSGTDKIKTESELTQEVTRRDDFTNFRSRSEGHDGTSW